MKKAIACLTALLIISVSISMISCVDPVNSVPSNDASLKPQEEPKSTSSETTTTAEITEEPVASAPLSIDVDTFMGGSSPNTSAGHSRFGFVNGESYDFLISVDKGVLVTDFGDPYKTNSVGKVFSTDAGLVPEESEAVIEEDFRSSGSAYIRAYGWVGEDAEIVGEHPLSFVKIEIYQNGTPCGYAVLANAPHTWEGNLIKNELLLVKFAVGSDSFEGQELTKDLLQTRMAEDISSWKSSNGY